jgi:hypothetical protein
VDVVVGEALGSDGLHVGISAHAVGQIDGVANPLDAAERVLDSDCNRLAVLCWWATEARRAAAATAIKARTSTAMGRYSGQRR